MTAGERALVSRLGDFFFRWRSYLPLLLLPFVAIAIARFQYPFGSRGADLTWEVLCVLLALGGFAVRVYTVAFAAPGTSGRNTRKQKAASLNTTGPYSVVRHPLYLANSIIALGLSLFTHAWIVPPLVVILAVGYYACIAQREEQYLRKQFGAAFDAWAARVPAIIPALSRYVPADQPFEWRVVLRREFYALALILVMPLVLDVAEDLHETGVFDLDPVWTVAAAVGGGLFVVLRFLKKRTTVLVVERSAGSPLGHGGGDLRAIHVT